MALISNHNLDDRPCWKQASERMGYWSREPVSLAGLDCDCGRLGLASDEYSTLARLWAQSLEME